LKYKLFVYSFIIFLSACGQDKPRVSEGASNEIQASPEKSAMEQPIPTVKLGNVEALKSKKVLKAKSEAVSMPPAVDYEQPILVQLEVDLANIQSVVPKGKITLLQRTIIWVEQGMPIKKLNATFFNGGRALTKKHGLVPESYGGVIIGNTKGYLAVAGIKPWQMLHELTHAFHQFNLRHDFQPVRQAYTLAMENKLFDPVSDKRIPRRAYATKNQKEYLSVLSVIYFGKKFVYPRNRKELAEHDPIGYCAIVKAWGLLGKQQGDVIPLRCSSPL